MNYANYLVATVLYCILYIGIGRTKSHILFVMPPARTICRSRPNPNRFIGLHPDLDYEVRTQKYIHILQLKRQCHEIFDPWFFFH
jgi:hypothetical protein